MADTVTPELIKADLPDPNDRRMILETGLRRLDRPAGAVEVPEGRVRGFELRQEARQRGALARARVRPRVGAARDRVGITRTPHRLAAKGRLVPDEHARVGLPRRDDGVVGHGRALRRGADFLAAFLLGSRLARGLAAAASRSARMRSRRTDAGSSSGSCGTSSPRKALARMD